MRHAVGTTWLEKGLQPAITAALGHSTPAFTMSVYQHVVDRMGEQAAAVLVEALGLPAAASKVWQSLAAASGQVGAVRRVPHSWRTVAIAGSTAPRQRERVRARVSSLRLVSPV